jgi:hypothetical protein
LRLSIAALSGLLLLALPPAAEASVFELTPLPSSTPAVAVTSSKLGVGVYGGVAMDPLETMRPGAILVEDPDPASARLLRAAFPQAFIVGRHFVPDGDPSLANCQNPTEPHEAKGEDFGQIVARRAVPLRGLVDAWVGDNEQSSSADPGSLACHAQFELGFINRLQGRYGIAAIAGNDASGAVDPQDYVKYFAQPISQAVYFGLHAYSKPGAGTLQSSDAAFYALRYRQLHDALLQAGAALPKGGFVLTETGLYEGWRAQVTDSTMARDFTWLEQQLEQDDYVRGAMIFGLAVGSQYQSYELARSGIPNAVGAYNATRSTSATLT